MGLAGRWSSRKKLERAAPLLACLGYRLGRGSGLEGQGLLALTLTLTLTLTLSLTLSLTPAQPQRQPQP